MFELVGWVVIRFMKIRAVVLSCEADLWNIIFHCFGRWIILLSVALSQAQNQHPRPTTWVFVHREQYHHSVNRFMMHDRWHFTWSTTVPVFNIGYSVQMLNPETVKTRFNQQYRVVLLENTATSSYPLRLLR